MYFCIVNHPRNESNYDGLGEASAAHKFDVIRKTEFLLTETGCLQL